MLPRAHQRQFNLVLNVLDVQRGPGGETALEYAADLGRQRGHQFADARRRGAAATFDGQERLGHGDGDLVVVVGHDLAGALDDLEQARSGGGNARRRLNKRVPGGFGDSVFHGVGFLAL